MTSPLMKELRSLEDPVGKWELIERIGEGTYGEVYKARNIKTGELHAIKVMDNILEKEEDIKAELDVYRHHSQHPNIASFYGAYMKKETLMGEEQLWLVMEYCHGGSVTDVVKSVHERGEYMEEDCISFILREVLQGLFYLHNSHIIHRDIKGQNVLLTREAQVKLIDFGIAAKMAHTMDKRHSHIGTPFWMAPEVIACESQYDLEYDYKADIWSLGITGIELADSVTPYHGEHPARVLFRIPREPPPTVKEPSIWSASYLDFLSQCLVKDMDKRPGVLELLTHEFVDTNHDPRVICRKLMILIELSRGPRFDFQDGESSLNRLEINLDKTATIKRSQTKLPADQVSDLAELEAIDESIMVHYIHERYNRNLIYTYVGDVLISINPFQIFDIYNPNMKRIYSHFGNRRNLPPHIYAVSDRAYQAMLLNKQAQCCLISGESGAGKTEGSKLILQHLMTIGKAVSREVEDKILKVNPVLEAFGNARTAFNDNSSRFGKYIEIYFNKYGSVLGAEITQYLLEKSRLIHQSRRERSFHIFYYLLSFLTQQDKLSEFYFSEELNEHRYLRVLGTKPEKGKIKTMNSSNFELIRHALDVIGFTPKEKFSMYSIVSAILHMGDIQIEIDVRSLNFQSHISESTLVSNRDTAKKAGNLLKVDTDKLIEVITNMLVFTHGEQIIIPHRLEQAMDIRDAISKALYGRLFSWIVRKINASIVPRRMPEDCYSIGLLDIFGFENFKKNSLEQLNINIANEQLQYFFNQHIFTLEQAEYHKEGISAEHIAFTNNQPILDILMGRPHGILSLLDDESKFSSATDLSLVTKFHKEYGKNKYYIRPKSDHPTFGVIHYAGRVNYSASGFLQKNRDTLQNSSVLLLRESSDPLIKELFSEHFVSDGSLMAGSVSKSKQQDSNSRIISRREKVMTQNFGKQSQSTTPPVTTSPTSLSRNQTVSTHFRHSLRDLMLKIESSQPHFIRCIDPNGTKSPEVFIPHKVLEQLRYTGVLETCKIRKQGYSNRILFEDFIDRYKAIDLTFGLKINRPFANCAQILESAKIRGYQLGKSKVFLRYYHIEQLNEIVKQYQKHALILQRYARGFLARNFRKRIIFNRRNNASGVIGRVVRFWLLRVHMRGYIARETRYIVLVQAAVRGKMTQMWFRMLRFQRRREIKAAIKIQVRIRLWLARLRFSHLQEKIILENTIRLQAFFRGCLARKEYRNMLRLHHSALIIQRRYRQYRNKAKLELVQKVTRANSLIMSRNPRAVSRDFDMWIDEVLPSKSEQIHLESRGQRMKQQYQTGSLRKRLANKILDEYSREMAAITIQKNWRGRRIRKASKVAFIRATNERRAVTNFLTEMNNICRSIYKKEAQLMEMPWTFNNIIQGDIHLSPIIHFDTNTAKESRTYFRKLEQNYQQNQIKIPRPHLAGKALIQPSRPDIPQEGDSSAEYNIKIQNVNVDLKKAQFNFANLYSVPAANAK